MSKTTTKSPAAPSRSLEPCFELAAKIYDAYSHTEFGAPEIAGTANLSATSGQAKGLVSDLKQYGLIEKVQAGRHAISQQFKDAHALTPGSAEFKAAMYQFVKHPSVFQKVLADVKGKLPDEQALANNLRSTHQFNPKKAKSTATALSASLAWVGVLDAKRNIIEQRDEKHVAERSSTADSSLATVDDRSTDDAQLMGKPLSIDIPLADGRLAQVRCPLDLTPEEAAKIGKVLAAICS